MIASDRLIKIVEDWVKNQENISMGRAYRYATVTRNLLMGKLGTVRTVGISLGIREKPPL